MHVWLAETHCWSFYRNNFPWKLGVMNHCVVVWSNKMLLQTSTGWPDTLYILVMIVTSNVHCQRRNCTRLLVCHSNQLRLNHAKAVRESRALRPLKRKLWCTELIHHEGGESLLDHYTESCLLLHQSERRVGGKSLPDLCTESCLAPDSHMCRCNEGSSSYL